MNTSNYFKRIIDLGDLVKLRSPSLDRRHDGCASCLGIVTAIRSPAGMHESKQCAQVLWENNRYAEHYLADLEKV